MSKAEIGSLLEGYYGEIKTGLLKKEKIVLFVYKSFIDGTGTIFKDNKFIIYSFKINFSDMKEIGQEIINENNCVIITYLNRETISGNSICTLILPNLKKSDEAVSQLSQLKKYIEKENEEKAQKEKNRMELQIKYEQECKSFYDNCYKFHILENNNPFYELINDTLIFGCIYIDKEKNINILKIDGNKQEESNAIIPYSNLHYYDVAGNIQYATDIKANYSSLGGSITGSTFSKGATVLGTLLFGMMGMVGGALLTHKPAQTEIPNTSFDISSNIQKIDDRNVIVNYYSDLKRQYMDIEFPKDTYNFLQTYLPEKKHDIVIEIEKQQVLRNDQNNVVIEIPVQEQAAIEQQNSMEDFALKLQKLKIMYDTGILTDIEYECEKKRILSEL